MLSRRDFLASVARVAPLAGAAGLGWDGPARAAELARILLVDPLESSAPRARYWVGVPATKGDCLACHGPSGDGNPAAKYPALKGQHADYTAKQLRDYAAGTRMTDGKTSIMRDIAARLSAEDIEALSSYVQGLR